MHFIDNQKKTAEPPKLWEACVCYCPLLLV